MSVHRSRSRPEDRVEGVAEGAVDPAHRRLDAEVVDQAAGLGLRGWVRNRIDGGVEAVFAGPPEAVAEMVRHCRRGPAYARVERVDENPEADPVGPGFRIAPTA